MATTGEGGSPLTQLVSALVLMRKPKGQSPGVGVVPGKTTLCTWISLTTELAIQTRKLSREKGDTVTHHVSTAGLCAIGPIPWMGKLRHGRITAPLVNRAEHRAGLHALPSASGGNFQDTVEVRLAGLVTGGSN